MSRRSRRISTALLFAVFGSAALARAGEAELDRALAELGQASARVTALRARFVQEKHVAIVSDVLRSSGIFVLDKRGRIAWDVSEPESMRIVITRDGVFAGGKPVLGKGAATAAGNAKFSALPLLEGLSGIFAGISPATKRDFEITLLDRDRVRLKPRSPALAAWLSAIEITLDRKTRVPVRLRLVEPGGDLTEITFSDMLVNPTLDDAAFAP